MTYPAIVTDIDTSGFVAVRLPANHMCQAFSLWTEDGAAWVYSHNAAGDRPITITADGVTGLALALNIIHQKDSAGAILCYAKGTTDTNLVGLITKL